MADHDPYWGMPDVDWQPTSSFNSPIAPPLDDPLVGPLVQLPCVNQQWVPIILGCLAQLTDPGVWLASLTDDQRSLVLNRVDSLRSAMAGTVSTPCCDVRMRLTSDCHLQFSVDNGATYTTVDGWDANLDGCVKAHVPPQVPVPVAPGLPNNNACSVAGWLQSELASITAQHLHDALAAAQSVDHWITSVVDDIVAFAPILAFVVSPFQTMYNTALPQPLTDLQDSINDAGFQASVRCAIYNAIKGTGYVTAGNFAQVATNLAAIAYVHAWVPPMYANLWTNLGLQSIQTLQAEGSITASDCSACGEWCHIFDFTLSDQGWSAYLAGTVYHPGEGWVAPFNNAGGGLTELGILVDLIAPIGLTKMQMQVIAPNPEIAGDLCLKLWGSHDFTMFLTECCFTPVQDNTVQTFQCGPFAQGGVQRVSLAHESSGGALDNVAVTVTLIGDGPSPFGISNCAPF